MTDPRIDEGIRLIRAQQWFEAHEVLEDPWREADGAHKAFLHALIHGAVSLEHLKRGNPRGAWGQWNKALHRFLHLPPNVEGWNIGAWKAALIEFYEGIDLEERSRRHVARQTMEGLPPLPPTDTWPQLNRR